MISCALALVLLLDVSQSVSPNDYVLQRDGVAQAFADPQIQQIIEREGGVAVTVIEWATNQRTVVPWQHLTNRDHVTQFSQTVSQLQRSQSSLTGIGDAIRAAISSLDQAPCDPERIVFDVSGDGVNNVGTLPEDARDAAAELGVQINGLPIVNSTNNTNAQLEEFYRQAVITPNGFVVVAQGFADFARAIRRKLVLEIGQLTD